MLSEKQKILNYFVRANYHDGEFEFQELLKDAAKFELNIYDVDLDIYVMSNINRYWNIALKLIEQDKQKGLSPIFDITDEYAKKIRWFGKPNQYDSKLIRKYHLLQSRSTIINKIDLFSSRQYEALSCFVCMLLGAKNILLTPSNDEGGVDFLATIHFSHDSHYFFGLNGPIRIVGQSKKYNDKVSVDKIREFNSTLNDIYSLSKCIECIIPNWFKQAKGPIIGWIIGHSGFQSGAITRAKNYGIITSDTRDLAELISNSRKFNTWMKPAERADLLLPTIDRVIIQNSEINMDLFPRLV